jgi:hypothetical protein
MALPAVATRNGRRMGSPSNRNMQVTVIVPCILCGIGIVLVLYQIAWMYWLPGLLMVHDTETTTIITGNNVDGTLVASTRTVTRRRPDQLYRYDHQSGQKVPK